MTDCKGAFAFGYDVDIGGAQAAFAQFAHGVTKSHAKPSAGMTGIHVGATPIQIVGYGCGNDTVRVAVTETKRLMEKLNADVMVGPLSGDEAVYVANYAKAHPTKTFIIGTAGSQDPTMQIAPKNLFRYHGDGAQWNAGIGEIAYKKLGWRKAAIIDGRLQLRLDVGRRHDRRLLRGRRPDLKRVFPPLNTTDYAPFVRQLPPPNQVDGYFWVVGGTGTGAAAEGVRAGLRQARPEEGHRQPVLRLPRGGQGRRPRRSSARTSAASGTARASTTPKVDAYRAYAKKVYPTATELGRWVLLQLLHGREGAVHRACPSPGGAVGAKLAGRAAAVDRRSVPGLQRREGQARLPAPGDPGPVPAPARQERRRVGMLRRWSRTSRASTSRSAACSRRRARRPAARSLRARR